MSTSTSGRTQRSSPPSSSTPSCSADAAVSTPAFSEKEFYLEEFHGRTVALAVAASELDAPEELLRVVRELLENGTHVLLLSTERVSLELVEGSELLSLDAVESDDQLGGILWRGLRRAGCVGLVISNRGGFPAACGRIAVRLGLTKLVFIDRGGGVVRGAGERVSFMHLQELSGFDEPERPRRSQLLREIETMLRAGVSAVNLCSLSGLHEELFSYDGSGTLFTEERYVLVRRIGIDDYDAASDLIRRGVSEGYLAPRSESQIDRVLASGFGAFIEGLHLAGIGALLPALQGACAEVASLYTLTRFLGEGVGGHLVQHAVEEAQRRSMHYVFACTTAERVVRFFERHGFAQVSQEQVPPEKWDGYEGERRRAIVCLRRDLAAG